MITTAERLKTIQNTTRLIGELKEKRAHQEKLLSEMEYVLYMKFLWESRDSEPFDDKTSYYPKFVFFGGSRTKGWLALVRVCNKTEIRFPVHMKYMIFTGVTDMWDNGELPERFIEIFFENMAKRKNQDIGSVKGYRSQRDKRLKDNADFKERYGHDRTPRPLMEPLKITASGDEIRLGSFPQDGGAEEVESPEGIEGSESKEGKEVA
jgi:hypothetical protein